MKDRPRRLPLPVRRQMNLTSAAYDKLRDLNTKWGLGNNYLLVVLLENLDEVVDPDRLDAAYARFIEQYSAPNPKQSGAKAQAGQT